MSDSTLASGAIGVRENGLTLKVARGSLWSLGSQGVTLLASLITTPIVIRCLGPEAYGVLALIGVVLAYFAFSDLGMSTASTRFAAERHARGDGDGEVAVVWTCLLMIAGPVLLVGLGLVLIAPALVVLLLDIPTHLQQDSILAFRLAAVAVVARSIAGVLNTPQLVRLHMRVYNLINTGGSVLQMVLVPTVLLLGGGLVSVVSVMAFVSVVNAGVHALYSNRYLRWLTEPRIQRDLFRPLLRFGTSILFIIFAGTLLFHIEKPLLASLSSVRELGYYAVAFTVARILVLVPGALNQSLLPAMSRLQADPNPVRLEELFFRAVRGVVLWILPATVIVWVLASPFLHVWAGDAFMRGSLLPLHILLVGALFDGTSYVPRAFLEAVGKPELIARCQLIELIPYLVVAYFSIAWFGAAGAAFAWSLRAIVEAFLVFHAAQGVFRFRRLSALTKPGAALTLLAVTTPVLVTELTTVSVEVVAAVLIASLVLFGALAWRNLLTHEERAWIQCFVRTRSMTGAAQRISR